MKDYLAEYPETKNWFPNVDSFGDANKAVTRSITRLMAFASEKEGHFKAIDLEVQSLRMSSDNDHDTLSVMVVGTTQGNTSSGLFPLIPSILRQLRDRLCISRGIALRGMLVDVTSFFSNLAEQNNVLPQLLVSDAFSSNEILCIRTRHSYMFEDLLRYRPESEYEQAYHGYISGIGNTSYVIRNVTSHLDKHWYKNLPDIDPENR